MPGTTLPPFPNNVRTYPLLVIDFDLLKTGDATEVERLWQAGTSIGCWYLKNSGADKEVNDMLDLGAKVMALPLEERLKFDQGDAGKWHGYKEFGSNIVENTGKPDSAETLNICQDDALAFPDVVHRTYPPPVAEAMLTVVCPYIYKSLEVNNTIIRIFNKILGLPEGTLERLHSEDKFSYSEARMTRVLPPKQPDADDSPMMADHTDFSSVTFLHNTLGGSQVMPHGHTEWSYVKPLPGHAICMIGQALTMFSGGILRSILHRMIQPPGEQAEHESWSIGFFSRPGNSSVHRALVEDSSLIADAVQRRSDRHFDTGKTAEEIFTTLLKKRRMHRSRERTMACCFLP